MKHFTTVPSKARDALACAQLWYGTTEKALAIHPPGDLNLCQGSKLCKESGDVGG
jgi:hypothetical protein